MAVVLLQHLLPSARTWSSATFAWKCALIARPPAQRGSAKRVTSERIATRNAKRKIGRRSTAMQEVASVCAAKSWVEGSRWWWQWRWCCSCISNVNWTLSYLFYFVLFGFLYLFNILRKGEERNEIYSKMQRKQHAADVHHTIHLHTACKICARTVAVRCCVCNMCVCVQYVCFFPNMLGIYHIAHESQNMVKKRIEHPNWRGKGETWKPQKNKTKTNRIQRQGRDEPNIIQNPRSSSFSHVVFLVVANHKCTT